MWWGYHGQLCGVITLLTFRIYTDFGLTLQQWTFSVSFMGRMAEWYLQRQKWPQRRDIVGLVWGAVARTFAIRVLSHCLACTVASISVAQVRPDCRKIIRKKHSSISFLTSRTVKSTACSYFSRSVKQINGLRTNNQSPISHHQLILDIEWDERLNWVVFCVTYSWQSITDEGT